MTMPAQQPANAPSAEQPHAPSSMQVGQRPQAPSTPARGARRYRGPLAQLIVGMLLALIGVVVPFIALLVGAAADPRLWTDILSQPLARAVGRGWELHSAAVVYWPTLVVMLIGAAMVVAATVLVPLAIANLIIVATGATEPRRADESEADAAGRRRWARWLRVGVLVWALAPVAPIVVYGALTFVDDTFWTGALWLLTFVLFLFEPRSFPSLPAEAWWTVGLVAIVPVLSLAGAVLSLVSLAKVMAARRTPAAQGQRAEHPAGPAPDGSVGVRPDVQHVANPAGPATVWAPTGQPGGGELHGGQPIAGQSHAGQAASPHPHAAPPHPQQPPAP